MERLTLQIVQIQKFVWLPMDVTKVKNSPIMFIIVIIVVIIISQL